VEALYKKTILCDQCNSQFETSKVRSSFIRVEKRDSDFCAHYRGINPNFYDVRVCPNCGSASTEKFTVAFTRVTKDVFQDKIGKNWRIQNFAGERTWEDALKCYKMALLSAQIRGERDVIMAQLLHHIAWLYRINESEAHSSEERRFLGFALKHYIAAYEKDMSDFNLARLLYIIGELHARTGDSNEAIKWFGKVVNDKRITDPQMVQMARDRWNDLRSSS
jgi:uncharacterized protein (DUF2225 family)